MDRDFRKRKRILGGAKYMTMNDGCVRNSTEMVVDRWLDLPNGPLGEIFSKLNPIDVVLVIPLVCKYWGQIFLKELCFLQEDGKCLDFSPLAEEPFYSYFYQLGDENARAKRLMSLIVGLLHAFTFGSENDSHNSAARPTSITDIKLVGELPFHDRHLVYIAERCPELRGIQLPCMKNITGKGMARAMRCWGCVDRMVCGPFSHVHLPRIIQEIGINCKNLHSIQLNNFELRWQSAELIVRNLKSVKIFTLYRAEISTYGLFIFLSRWKKPVTLYLCSSSCTNDKDRGVKPHFTIWNIQQGRSTRWRIERNRDDMGKLNTSEGLPHVIRKLKIFAQMKGLYRTSWN